MRRKIGRESKERESELFERECEEGNGKEDGKQINVGVQRK